MNAEDVDLSVSGPSSTQFQDKTAGPPEAHSRTLLSSRSCTRRLRSKSSPTTCGRSVNRVGLGVRPARAGGGGSVVPLTASGPQGARGPTVVPLAPAETGLRVESFALCHQVTTLDRGPGEAVGTLSRTALDLVGRGVAKASDIRLGE